MVWDLLRSAVRRTFMAPSILERRRRDIGNVEGKVVIYLGVKRVIHRYRYIAIDRFLLVVEARGACQAP